jgi:hypothetical protein
MIRISKGMAAAAALIGVGVSGAALGQVTYDYTGSDFTAAVAPFTTFESLTGSVTLASALAGNDNLEQVSPTAFSFSVGGQAISNLTAGVTDQFRFTTNAAGAITAWALSIEDPTLEYSTFSTGTNTASDDVLDVQGSPTILADTQTAGTWALQPVAVPQPVAAPEIESASAASGLTLLIGLLLVFRGRPQRPLAA